MPKEPDNNKLPSKTARLASANKLAAWFNQEPPPMTKMRFAEELGVSASYVSQLTRKRRPPWPGRDVALKIGIITKGAVTPNDLAGYAEGMREPAE